VDGRNICARSGAAIATLITVAGLELVSAGVASAATPATTTMAPRTSASSSDKDVAAARALADRLASQADRVGQRHDEVQASLDQARQQLRTLTVGIQHQRRSTRAVKAEVADLAGDSSGSPEGSYDAAQGAPSPPVDSTPASSNLLTNVVVVSEDTGGLAQQMSSSDQELVGLTQQRAALTRQVTTLSTREHALAASETQLQHRADQAQARVTHLIGGPAVAYALSKVGDSYVWGASGPSAFDCSGLMMASWAQAGVALPHSSSAQYASGRHISESELQPGDLVFYYSPISHVGMYIGDGKIVNALNPGAGVVISGLHDMPYSGAVRPG
jgi:cell wall-associated NlpC family hydrolase